MAELSKERKRKVAMSVYLHIGYGRTATTWLQNSLFPRLTGIKYLGKTRTDYPRWMMDWNYLDRLLLPKVIDNIRFYLDAGGSSQRVLISSEAFTQTGGIVDQIERIKAVVAKPYIFVVLREPTSLVISKYRRLCMAGFFHQELEHYLDFATSPYDLVRRRRLYLHDYNYPLVIERLRNEFGDDRVLVKKYETLNAHPQMFVADVSRYLGVPVPVAVNYEVVNRSDCNIWINPDTIDGLHKFFGELFDYAAIEDGFKADI